MERYKVRVWLEDIEIEADSPSEAEDKATELIDGELSKHLVEYSETQQILVDGKWKYI